MLFVELLKYRSGSKHLSKPVKLFLAINNFLTSVNMTNRCQQKSM